MCTNHAAALVSAYEAECIYDVSLARRDYMTSKCMLLLLTKKNCCVRDQINAIKTAVKLIGAGTWNVSIKGVNL
jgi:hypothetical protein